MKKLIIAVDMDETLVNLMDKWLYYHNNRYGTEWKRSDIKDYSFNGLFNHKEFRDFLRIPGFHADLPWMDSEAPHVLRALRKDGHRIIIATHSAAWEAPRDKYQWVHTHLRIPGLIDSMVNDVFLGGEKKLIRADILVDDGIHNLEGFPGYTICYNQPWNQEWKGPRAYDWWDVYQWVKGFEHSRDATGDDHQAVSEHSPSFWSGGCY